MKALTEAKEERFSSISDTLFDFIVRSIGINTKGMIRNRLRIMQLEKEIEEIKKLLRELIENSKKSS